MRKINLFILGVIVFSFAVGFYFCPQMPQEMASHWNSQGQVDGYIGKFWGVFLMPIISLAIFFMFLIIPKIDPLKKNIDKFRKYFDWFILLMVIFLFYIYLLTLFWNLGYRFNMGQLMIPALGILFFYIGILVEKAERNWFVGIRTPWTLSNDQVWQKTHQLGSKLFKISGIIAFIGVFFPRYSLWFVLIPVIFTAIWTTIYSYFEYQKENKKTGF